MAFGQMIVKSGTEEIMRVDAATNNIGIGTPSPQKKLDVAGTIRTQGFQLPTGAQDNYVLTSDASGTASWQSYERVRMLSENLLLDGNDGSEIVPPATEGTFSQTVSNLPPNTKFVNIRLACGANDNGGFQVRAMRQNSTDPLMHGLGSCLVSGTGDRDTAVISYVPVYATGTSGQYRIYFNWSGSSNDAYYHVRVINAVY
jgi:hypothetical protein